MPSHHPSRQASRQSSHHSPSHHPSRQSSKHKALESKSSKVLVPTSSKHSKDPPPTIDHGPKTSPPKKTEMEKICNETVTVPPQLPDILKQYAKGAMRTQPPDLLRWSGMYFRSMANGETLPVKDRLEFPMRESPDGLTAGLLRVLDTQLGGSGGKKVPTNDVQKKWRGMGLNVYGLTKILQKADMDDSNVLEWDKLMAVMATTIGKNLTEAMKVICEVLTDQPDGMEPLISFKMWWNLYLYLTQLNGKVSSGTIQALNDYLVPVSSENAGHIGPKDFTGNRCPPLE